MGMMMAMARNIAVANETMQHGEWNRKKYVGVELRGKTVRERALALADIAHPDFRDELRDTAAQMG